MSHRRPVLRTSLSRLAVAGAATLASVMTIAPAAIAADEPTTDPGDTTRTVQDPTPEATPEPAPEPTKETPPAPEPEPDPEPSKPAPSPTETTPDEPEPADGTPVPPKASSRTLDVPDVSSQEVAEEDLAPDFGFQKFRVGVKIADGSYVPDGTSPVGSTFDITYTDQDGGTSTFSCTATEVDGDTAYCPAPSTGIQERSALSVTPGNPFGQNFTAPAGSTVSITQTSAPAGLVVDPDSAFLDTCEKLALGEDELPCNTSNVVFDDAGVPPVANNDRVSTPAGTPVTIDVLSNDADLDPAATISVDDPTHGTAEVVTVDGREQVRYTPDDGFNGVQRFTYTIDGTNGSSSAQIRVDVGEVVPVYGTQKYRIGVQVADGSYVPTGVTTAGSTFTITTTKQDGTSTTATCTSGTASPTAPYASSCPEQFMAPAGATVTVVQASAPEGLVKSSETKTLEPCDTNEDECDTLFGSFLQFEDTGLPPVARDDKARTDEGESVRIDVLDNDDSDDPATTISVDTDPDHGDAKVVGRSSTRARVQAVPSAGTLAIEYTPAKGFSGTDTFDYALESSNGTVTATVTVRVAADDSGVSDDDSTSSGVDDDANLPDTGGSDVRLLGLAGLLVAGGAVVTARTRRRRDDVHAG